jgi:hypothetical protein
LNGRDAAGIGPILEKLKNNLKFSDKVMRAMHLSTALVRSVCSPEGLV